MRTAANARLIDACVPCRRVSRWHACAGKGITQAADKAAFIAWACEVAGVAAEGTPQEVVGVVVMLQHGWAQREQPAKREVNHRQVLVKVESL